ncbi:MAG: acyl-CoA synthetase [Candidatus Thermoplasmatota archaeon]|jgi:uncharacterized protein (TIGR00725 family)|nr:acyl-CoA synthetase [Candidatus Thermoplasmatota archaeon]
MRKKTVSIIGDNHFKGGRDSDQWAVLVKLSRLIIDNGFRVMTGGIGDLPAAIYEGAKKSPRYTRNEIIAVLPGYDPDVAESYSDIQIATGLDIYRSLIVSNADAVVAVGGGAGTLMEIASAWALKRPIFALKLEGWSGQLGGKRIDDRERYRNIPSDSIYSFDDPEALVSALIGTIQLYQKRHHGIPDSKQA